MSTYHPVLFYAIVLLTTFALCPVATYLNLHPELSKWKIALFFLALTIPCITALAMIYASEDQMLIADFWKRLVSVKIGAPYLALIVLFMPCVICLATAISVLFGQSADQFLLTKEMSAMKGWSILGILIPLVLAPLIEEIGWRGYGVDSLRAYTNLFYTSVLFGVFWAAWHLPAFFFKGSYQNDLWHLGAVYAINFFVSIFLIAFWVNWAYYKVDRSILAIALFHGMLNLSSMVLRTEQVTKCIATGILCLMTVLLIACERDFFFERSF